MIAFSGGLILDPDLPFSVLTSNIISLLLLGTLYLSNRQLGHAEGDAALILVADLLRRSFSEYGVVTRYAGDEFVVMMNTTTRRSSAS